jgi:hypothetical protein
VKTRIHPALALAVASVVGCAVFVVTYCPGETPARFTLTRPVICLMRGATCAVPSLW